ncbi:MAG: hypothetical protein KDC53_12200 [Saprospiraceae bacterium]|nr:hypothetical protein [Saprospiraceae bacterium]
MNLFLTYRHFFTIIFTIISGSLLSQEMNTNDEPLSQQETHIAMHDFPKDMVINHIEGWGGMTVAVNEMPAGSDLGPLLEGLKNNSCQVPHWGYMIAGVLKLTYDDGREETLKAGDLFYMPPGHVGVVMEDIKIMDFSPQKGMHDVIKHIEYKLAEFQKQDAKN